MSKIYAVHTRCANCGMMGQAKIPFGEFAKAYLQGVSCSYCGCSILSEAGRCAEFPEDNDEVRSEIADFTDQLNKDKKA